MGAQAAGQGSARGDTVVLVCAPALNGCSSSNHASSDCSGSGSRDQPRRTVFAHILPLPHKLGQARKQRSAAYQDALTTGKRTIIAQHVCKFAADFGHVSQVVLQAGGPEAGGGGRPLALHTVGRGRNESGGVCQQGGVHAQVCMRVYSAGQSDSQARPCWLLSQPCQHPPHSPAPTP